MNKFLNKEMLLMLLMYVVHSWLTKHRMINQSQMGSSPQLPTEFSDSICTAPYFYVGVSWL